MRRRLLLAAFIAVVAQSAHAADPADLPILRGAYVDPPPAAAVIPPDAWRDGLRRVCVVHRPEEPAHTKGQHDVRHHHPHRRQ